MRTLFSTPLLIGHCLGVLALLFANPSYAFSHNDTIQINSASDPNEDGSPTHPIHIKQGETLQLNVVIFRFNQNLDMHKIKISSISNKNFEYAPYMHTICIVDEHNQYPCRGQIFLKYVGGNFEEQQPVTLTFSTFDDPKDQKNSTPLLIEAPLYLVVEHSIPNPS